MVEALSYFPFNSFQLPVFIVLFLSLVEVSRDLGLPAFGARVGETRSPK